MTARKDAHVVFVPFHGWGHLRPMLVLTFRLLILAPQLRITYLCPPVVPPRIKHELQLPSFAYVHQRLDEKSSSPFERLQLINVSHEGELNAAMSVAVSPQFYVDIKQYLVWLWRGKDETLHGRLNRFSGIECSAIVMDALHFFLPDVVVAFAKELDIASPPLLTLQSFPPSYALGAFAAAEDGGHFDRYAKVYAAAKQDGATDEEAIGKAWRPNEGEITRVPGMPEMHDYEWMPMETVMPAAELKLPGLYLMIGSLPRHSAISHIISTHLPDWHQADAAALHKAFKQEPLLVGPQFAEPVWQVIAQDHDSQSSLEPTDDEKDRALLAWLARQEHRSVAYFSLGTGAFPIKRPELMNDIIDCALESGLHVLFANATPRGQAHAKIFERYSTDDRVYATEWTPQWRVLHDPAVAFFITHGGAGGSSEALMSLMPVVVIPFYGDQHMTAAHLCQTQRVGIEPVQIKQFQRSSSSPAERPLMTYSGVEWIGTNEAMRTELREVFRRMMDEGDEMRARLKTLRQEACDSRTSGAAKANMDRLLEVIGASWI